MVNVKILLSIVIVLLIGVAAASYQMTTNAPGLWQPTSPQEQKSTDLSKDIQSGGSQSGTQGGTASGGSQSGDGGSNMKISSKEAKSIAQKSIQEPGATAGTPKLMTINGKKTYYVPITSSDGTKIGGFYIDPQTGEITGMEGGVKYP